MEVTLATVLESITTFFTSAIAWMGSVIQVIMENPMLLIMCVCIPIAGVAIGYLSRLIRL